MTGIELLIISAPLLPSLVPLNEEESLLFSHIKPLQGAALIKAVGITTADLGAAKKREKGKKRKSNAWVIPPAKDPASGAIMPHTQEPQYDTRSTSDTYEDLPFSQNLRRMVEACPTMMEEHLSLTLEKHDNDLPTTLAWAQTIAEMKHLRRTLVLAYPTVSIEEVEGVVKQFKGDFMLSFNLLGCTHDPAEDWMDFAFARRQGVMSFVTNMPEIVYDDPATRSFENQWWRTCIMIRRHRVSQYPKMDALWPKLTPITVAPCPISQCFLQYINDLRNYNTNRPLFSKAVGILRAQQDFTGLVVLLGEPRPHFKGGDNHHPALTILQVLVGDGLASPAAAAWLALCVFRDPEMYDTYIPLFYGFPTIRRKMWNDRNIHMAASMKAASQLGSATASKIDATAAKDMYMSTVPGTIKHALEKQREKATARPSKPKQDKTSVGSQGSKKSRRLRGISPDGDIPEEDGEQEGQDKNAQSDKE